MMKKWELINFCEFDNNASKAYCSIHDEDESKNLGDITKVDETNLKSFNFICGGSPCQDFSVAGKQKGSVWKCKKCGEEFNPIMVHWSKRDECPHCKSKELDKSRSSLLIEWLRVIRANKPNFGLYENVKNIVSKKFEPTFNAFIDELHEYGYNTYYKVMNAKDYNSPTKRERVFLIIIKKELDNRKFKFPNKIINNSLSFLNMLEKKSDVIFKDIEIYKHQYDKIKTFGANYSFGGYVSDSNIYGTITASYGKISGNSMKFYRDDILSILTPLETFRIMGFEDEDYYKAKKTVKNYKNLYKRIGNSIVVNIPYEIFKSLYSVMPYLFDDLKVGSYFSGIGAIEKALDRLYNDINNKRI